MLGIEYWGVFMKYLNNEVEHKAIIDINDEIFINKSVLRVRHELRNMVWREVKDGVGRMFYDIYESWYQG